MAKKPSTVSDAAATLGRRSAKIRREELGEAAYVQQMRAWGKRGGRPRKTVKEGQR